MGAQLRKVREHSGLTQDEVAARMGLKGKGRRSHVARLERGENANPHARTLILYLKACGAPMGKLFDQFDTTIDFVPVEEKFNKAWDAAGLEIIGVKPEKRAQVLARVKAWILNKTTSETDKYQLKAVFPLRGKPVEPDEARRRTEKLAEYRIHENTIKRAVIEYLTTTKLPPVFYWCYTLYMRSVLGVVRKAEKVTTDTTGCRLADERLNDRLIRKRMSFERHCLDWEILPGVERVVMETWEKIRG
jgi:transcriptional regulator with XRE-family HTH domain